MSIEQALIAQAQPNMLRAMLHAELGEEIAKGCSPDIASRPVSLEPRFDPLWKASSCANHHAKIHWTIASPVLKEEQVRLQIWISPEHTLDWIKSERFCKQLQAADHRVVFEIIGNRAGITLGFVIHRQDFHLVSAAFHGEFDLCELTQMENGQLEGLSVLAWEDLAFRDYFPPPPYSHLFTRPPELQSSTLMPLIRVLSTLDTSTLGIFQVLFQPVSPNRDWHHNVKILLDMEYAAKLHNELRFSQKYLQQSPSGDLHHMAVDVESKAHNDKPFYAAALRIAVIGGGERGKDLLSGLASFMGLFQHGGRPLGYLTEKEYGILSDEQIQDMFKWGLTYRPGFIMNSQELSGSVHVPALPADDHRIIPMPRIDMLSVVRNPKLAEGTWIGNCTYAGEPQKVCIPKDTRPKHLHFLGASGCGKSSTMEHMILEDIAGGDGVAVLDPHGDMVERLLCLIPAKDVSRVIYMNPADPHWIPLWNPLDTNEDQDIGRKANDLVMAIKSFVDSGGWGDRLENILRNLIFGLLHLKGATFLDISKLLNNRSESNQILIREILKLIENQSARQFWETDYKSYKPGDLSPPVNKLSKLLISGPVSLMLFQPDNRLHFRKMMDQGAIFLVNLSNMGITVRQVLGCFLLSILHLTALSRSDAPIRERKPFHVYCDESHNFVTDSLESMCAETRKYSVSLNMAHQYLSQFNKKKRDALSTMESSIIFRVDKSDADYLAKDLQGKVKPEALIGLGVGEAFARIGTEIVKMKTREPLKIPERHFRDRIIEASRRAYCRPAHEIQKWLRRAGDRWLEPHAPLVQEYRQGTATAPEEFEYEEF